MTVGELIAKLQTYDKDCKVEIVDADTGWYIDKIKIDKGIHNIPSAGENGSDPNTVYLWGTYEDMKGSVL